MLIFQGVGYLTVYDGICLVKVARDLTRPGPPKCSGLEGNPPYFMEILVAENTIVCPDM